MMSSSTKGFLALAFALLGATSASAAVLPNGSKLDNVDFERHVMGLFGRMGCNSGSCHGSFQGKGGFRLSLFGFDPDKDYEAVTKSGLGRRINAVDPDRSLLLLKATGQVLHDGGMRFSKDSWQYKIMRDWIARGAPWSRGSGSVQQVTVTPPELAFGKKTENKQLKVQARFADGSESDITPFCDFRTNDDAVAEVSNLGLVKSLRPGSTAIVVSYRGNVLPVRVLVPNELPKGFAYPKVPEVNYVDREVLSRLRQLKMVPSDLCSDEEFLRRVYIDTIAQLPTPEEVRTFLADKSADKRTRKIDELLQHPLHASMWATKFCDFTGNDTNSLEQPQGQKAKRSQMWHDWLKVRLHDNMAYDKIVHGILCATSREGKAPDAWVNQVNDLDEKVAKGHDYHDYAKRDTLDLYWRRQGQQQIELWGERTAAAFLGVRLECAQCHKHPFDRWSQTEYRAYANVFAAVSFGSSPDAKKAIDAENTARRAKFQKNNQFTPVKEIFVASQPGKTLPHPDTNSSLTPKAPGGPEIPFEKGKDPRETLFQWMRSPDNPFFARAFVNRIWGHYFGTGIVHPVDDFSLANPPSNDKLLEALAKDFIAHNFDIRYMERVVLNSRTYQLSSKTNDTNKYDRTNYSHGAVRPMMAEAVVDVLNSALGTTEKWGPEIRPNVKAVEVGASQFQNPQLAYAFRIFGRPPRTTACDCERAMDPALPQTLFLMTDSNVLGKLTEKGGRLEKLMSSKLSDDQVLEDLFLATLTRRPTAEEKSAFAEYRSRVTNRQAAFVDTIWALINTREFILNH